MSGLEALQEIVMRASASISSAASPNKNQGASFQQGGTRFHQADYKTKYERYMKRWRQGGDRTAMLHLLREHQVASYFCKGHTPLEPYSLWHADLVGAYDIVFVAIDPSRTTTTQVGAPKVPSISRATASGTLTLVSKPTSETSRCVYGTIQNVRGTKSGRPVSSQHEKDLQELTIEFCQAPMIALQGDTKFYVTKINGKETTTTTTSTPLPRTSNHPNESVVTSYGILPEPGSFGWSPMECRLEDSDDMDYIHFIQREVIQRYHGHYRWCEQHSWLCQRMGLPLEAALAIHAFTYHALPKPYWQWQTGDLLLSIRLQPKACTSVYIARPQDPKRLLEKVQDRYPHVFAKRLELQAANKDKYESDVDSSIDTDTETDTDSDEDGGEEQGCVLSDNDDTRPETKNMSHKRPRHH